MKVSAAGKDSAENAKSFLAREKLSTYLNLLEEQAENAEKMRRKMLEGLKKYKKKFGKKELLRFERRLGKLDAISKYLRLAIIELRKNEIANGIYSLRNAESLAYELYVSSTFGEHRKYGRSEYSELAYHIGSIRGKIEEILYLEFKQLKEE